MPAIDLTTLSDLSDADPKALLACINEAVVLEESDAAEINWQLLAFITADIARNTLDLDWAAVALRTYEIIQDEMPTAERDSFRLSAMTLRAFLIDKLGASASEQACDPKVIIDWFFASQEMTIDDAKRLAGEMRGPGGFGNIGSRNLLRLRKIKNRLRVLQLIQSSPVVHENVELHRWFALFDKLP